MLLRRNVKSTSTSSHMSKSKMSSFDSSITAVANSVPPIAVGGTVMINGRETAVNLTSETMSTTTPKSITTTSNDNDKNDDGTEGRRGEVGGGENNKTNAKSDWWADRHSLALLVTLYTAQGLPMGLAFGTIPFLLKERGSSYADIAWFSFAGLPYSMKLTIALIVDSLYHRGFGRRKSWIVPAQLALAFLMLCFAQQIHLWVQLNNVNKLAPIFLIIVSLTATQDIAVDGWSLTMLRRQNVAYASTCQSLGLSLGFFATFTIFLSLSNKEFCDIYLRPIMYKLLPILRINERTGALANLAGALRAVGVFYLSLTAYITFFKQERKTTTTTTTKTTSGVKLREQNQQKNDEIKRFHLHTKKSDADEKHINDDQFHLECDDDDGYDDQVLLGHVGDSAKNNGVITGQTFTYLTTVYRKIASTYSDMLFALRLPAVRSLVICLLIAKVGVSAHDNVTPLKLLDVGFSKEKMASMAVLQTPFTLFGTVLAGRWVGRHSPVRVYLAGWAMRLILSISGPVCVLMLQWMNGVVTPWFYSLVLMLSIIYSFASECLMFVGAGALFLTVSASSVHVAGSYLTLLNTSSNMGGIWHKALILWLVDKLTWRDEECLRKRISEQVQTAQECGIVVDGYLIICIALMPVAIIVGIHLFRTLPKLERLPESAWKASR